MESNDLDNLFKKNIVIFENTESEVNWNPQNGWEQYQKKYNKRLYIKKIVIYFSAAAVLTALSFLLLSILSVNQNAELTYRTGTNEIKKVVLPDGNEVWLNRNTQLIYSNNKLNHCEIKIEGEVWFTINSENCQDYQIIAANTKIFLKTGNFNLKAVPNSENVIITVEKGEVSVCDSSSNGLSMLIKKGDCCKVHKSSKLVSSGQNEDNNYLAWKTHKIVFNDTPMYTVVSVLSEIYNTKIEINNESIENCKITSTIENQSLDKIMDKINSLVKTEIVRLNNQYILIGKGCL
jgi:transmembrane sensor